jgi:enoyl-CoA hydratase/carnithine racemase
LSIGLVVKRRNAMIEEQKLRGRTTADLGRRDVLALAGSAVAARLATGQALAQSQGTATPVVQPKPTVVLDRPAEGVLLIGIDRIDDQNRIDIPTFRAIGQAYYQFEHDDDLKVAVLHGKGPDFSQGLDQASWGAALRNGPFQTSQNFIDPVATAGPERSKPLVVAVQGHVTRVAHELFLAADLRVAAQDAIFNQGEVAAASFPGGGATVRFVREAGWGNAMRYMLTGEDWGTDEAYRMGLVQIVTPPGQQLGRAVELAKRIAGYAPLGVQALLGSARRSFREGERVALLSLQPEFGRLSRSEDRQEYFRALQEKRSPVYVGR